jgi:hypothetical protein
VMGLVVGSWLSVTVAAVAASPAAQSCPGVTQPGGWVRAAAPQFPSGAQQLASYAVAPLHPQTMYVTNGAVVERTTDGGCSWAMAFTVPATPTASFPFSSATAKVVQVVAAGFRDFLVIADAAHPHVLVSTDTGQTWQTTDPGIVQADPTAPVPKLVADANGSTAYLLVHQTAAVAALASAGITTADVLYASTNGGGTWAPKPIAAGTATGFGNSGVTDVAVDQLAPANVWVTTFAGVEHSTDGGTSWSPVAAGADGAIEVTHQQGQPAAVLATSSSRSIAYFSADGGSSWAPLNTPGVVTSVAGVQNAAIATATRVFALHYASLTWLSIHAGAPSLSALSTDRTASPSWYACACGVDAPSVWRYTPGPFGAGTAGNSGGGTANVGAGGQSQLCQTASVPVGQRPWSPSAVTPVAKVLTLAPGQSVTVPYRFAVQPQELDVYYLADSGPRSVDFLCPFETGALWSALTVGKVRNLRVGLGEFRDYQLGQDAFDYAAEGCARQLAGDFVYRRDLPIGSVDQTFRDDLGAIRWGGNCTDDHANLAALDQVATGAGQDVPPAGASPFDIARQQQASFSGLAYKVIMHVAGSYFLTPSRQRGYLGPELAPVEKALVAAGIHQLGIWVPGATAKLHGDAFPSDTGRQDLHEVARATGAVAPGPMSCVRGGVMDVPAGAPLVCNYVKSASDVNLMGQQMASMLLSLRNFQPMRLTAVSGGGLVSKITPAVIPHLDYLLPHTLDFQVTYTCGPSNLGQTQTVQLAGTVGSLELATASAFVSCSRPAVLAPLSPVAALIVPPAPPVPPVPNPGPAPAGAPGPATAPNPASAPQAQAQGVAQGVVVPQQQEQPQLSFAAAGNEVANESGVNAMTSLPAPRHRRPLGGTGGPAALCLLAAVSFVGARTRLANFRQSGRYEDR